MAVQQLGEHVAHHILALLVTAKHPSGQPEHPVVVTPEDLFEFLLVNHLVACLLLYIQSNIPFS